MAYSTFIDDHSNTYSEPYIPEKIVGFHGIDPDLVSVGVSTVGSSGEKVMHELLTDLLGGSPSGHYHLTQDELAKLGKIIAALIPAGRTDVVLPAAGIDNHEALRNLLGGSSTGHYHLTEDELYRLGKLLTALIPVGETEVRVPTTVLPSGGTDNHEALTNLQGGSVNTDGTTEHYHFTEEEWTRLKILLDTTFPYDSPTPVFPNRPTTPSEDDPASDDEIPDYSALFANKEPSWGSLGLGGKCKTVKEEGRMYFGNVVKSDDVYQPALVVPAIYNNNNNSALTLCYTTSNALNFSKLQQNIAKARGITLGDMIYAHMGITTKLQSKYNNKKHFCFYCTYLNSTSKNIYYYGSSTSVHNPSTNQSGYLAGAYKSDAGNAGDQKIVCATGDGGVCIVAYEKDSKTSITTKVTTKGASIGMSVNPGCLRYGAGVFCATGSQGAANSSDGSNWNVNKSAPKNMTGLHYRSDFAYKDSTGKDCTGAFIACSKDTRIFYFSSDGYHWTQCSTTKVPLESVIAAAYDAKNKRYCVVGKPGNVACFSQDFVNWTPTYVSKVDLSVLDVVCAFDKFVIMPKDSNTLYTYAG